MAISRENQGVLNFLTSKGVRFNQPSDHQLSGGTACVTHVCNSYHFREGTNSKGRAVDLTGDLQAIFDALASIGPKPFAELIWNNPHAQERNIKGTDGKANTGVWRNIYDTAANAGDHIHVSEELGVFIDANSQPLIQGDGNMVAIDPITNGVWVTDSNGDLYAYDNAPYIAGLNTHPDWHAGGANAPCIGIGFWKGNGTDDGGNGVVFATRPPGSGQPNLYHIARTGKPC